MKQQISCRVEASWDSEAEVWVATSEDVPGLATEADTIEALSDKLRQMIPELMILNQNAKTMKNTRNFNSQPNEDDLFPEYDFDYSKAKPNRFINK